ncbi:4-(cytidine 5'-diphospho)-2-C-methyl-D-erythritol kinase [Shimia biformata]|uniref:4-(cytidine 5'-diphospho)-2-C-methyl-D-erythritol kinase n=1 Tax=Shimia biformata TaxID=1294299 RepID=UPI001950E068|nr:4-(cytidine 5'-diphospho)-2-C-methyl-D-erythritol kinase [Shimia biformata]
MRAEAFAPAKINLTLHVTGQRADGYHLLDSLVGFADIGDRVTAEKGKGLSLTVSGPMADGVPTDGTNLILKAARLMAPDGDAALSLEKHLPATSGIGGGSSDAAAALTALSRLWDTPLPPLEKIASLGADVPVCLSHVPQRLRGIGEDLTPLPPLPPCEILLVNPGIAVATPPVFAALSTKTNPPMPDTLPKWGDARALATWLHMMRNDLHKPAATLVPEIDAVLDALEETNCLIARMSGSGATCFALYEPGRGNAQRAANTLTQVHPNWWVAAGKLL